MDKQKALDEIKWMREGETITRDPQLIAYMVRDWQFTKDAELSDLCWAMCQDNCYKGDAIFLLDELENYINTQK